MEERPEVRVEFNGPAGNTYDIVARCMKAASKAGWPIETITAWRYEAMSLDRHHVIDMVFEHFKVREVVRVSQEISRDEVE